MKILIVTSEIVVNKYSQSICTAKVIRDLSKKYSVDVLTEPMTIWNFEERIKNKYLTVLPKNIIDKPKTFIEKLILKFFFINLRFIKRLQSFRKELSKLKLDSYDIILALGGGGFFEPLKAVSKLKTNALKIGFVHDPYPSSIFPKPYKTLENKFSKIEIDKLKKTFNNLDKLAFPSFLLGEWMNSYYRFGKNKICLLPHLLPIKKTNAIKTDEVENFLKKHSLIKEKFYFHAGTLLKHRPIESIIKQFKKIKSEGKLPEFKLLFIGDVKYEIQESDKDVIVVNQRLSTDIIDGISIYAKSLMIIEHIGNISPFLPGKFPEYISLNKPIMHLGPKNSETCRVAQNVTDLDLFNAALENSNQIYNLLIHGGAYISDRQFIKEYFTIDKFITTING